MGICSWYVQTNLNHNGAEEVFKACERLGKPFYGFKVIPFVTRMPRLNAVMPFVLIGSTFLSRNAEKSSKYRQGIFFNPKTFTPQAYAEHYGSNYLNSDLRVTTLAEISTDDYVLDYELFIRSNNDSKHISGGTLTFAQLLEIKKNAEEAAEKYYIGGDLFNQNSQIVLSSMKNVYAEWRLFVIHNQIITGSQYRPYIDELVPDDVFHLAREMIKIWDPHDIFAIDICDTDNGLKVVECNGFNNCGFYKSDVVKLVNEVSEYQEYKAQ